MDISRSTGRSSFSNFTKLLSVVDEVRAVILSVDRGHESDHTCLGNIFSAQFSEKSLD